MPAVGMRRSTRVFGVVMKGADSGRVLRSGRRLWPEQSVEAKPKRGNEGDDDLLKKPPRKAVKKDVVLETKPEAGRRQAKRGRGDDGVDRRFGIVYTRKRRRVAAAESSELSRRSGRRCVLAAVVRPCAGKSGCFSSLLVSVLRYIAKVKVTLRELSAFFLSEPLHGAFALRGVQFLQGPPTANVGICQLFGIRRFMPMFCVDYTAVPHCFEFLHSALLLKSLFKSFFLVHNPINIDSDYEDDEMEIDFPEHQSKLQISCDDFKRESSAIGTVKPDAIEINDSSFVHSPLRSTRLAGRNVQYRNITNLRSIRKRRTSLRKMKTRNSSTVSLQRYNGALASDLFGGRKNHRKRRSLRNVSTAGNLRNASSAKLDSTEGLGSSLCSTNILVMESDQCYRVEGAIVTLEMSASREWLLTVKKDGLTRYSFKAEKVMPPCSSNRLTHVITFSLDNRCKLEFANRQDWAVFKDLYKKCSDQNISAPVTKFIPVPGVREVSSYAEDNNSLFNRPDTYISVYGDELTRAMARRTANYDMDSDDKEWLSSKFNNEFQEHVSEDNFELIIDALEKVYYCNPDDCFDKQSAMNACQDYGSKEVVEAVYTYWMSKRKQQKRSLLIKVFQDHQSKRAPFVPPLLRKKRSFKRQPSQFGRCNQPSVLKAIAAAEQDALEENAVNRLEEAKAAVTKSTEIAVEKRKRAQALAEIADLATYRATMLIRIAEAALAAEADVAAGYFLH